MVDRRSGSGTEYNPGLYNPVYAQGEYGPVYILLYGPMYGLMYAPV